MKISTKGRYAIRLLVDLGEHVGGDYIALKDIAERQNISKKYLEQTGETMEAINWRKVPRELRLAMYYGLRKEVSHPLPALMIIHIVTEKNTARLSLSGRVYIRL